MAGVWLLAGGVLSGCMPFADNVWQPRYEGAQSINNNACGAGGAQSLTVRLNSDANLWLSPVYIDRKNYLSFAVQVATGATIRMASNEARIDTAGRMVPVPLEYQGNPEEISSQKDPRSYDLAGRHNVYVFHVRIDEIRSDELILIIPIITNPDNLDMVQVPYRRHRAVGFVGSC